MHRNPFTPPFERLPVSIAVFPLPGAILMPGTQLPLNIFEPRYLNMIEDALGAGRLIGMIQPLEGDEHALADTGCAGRIGSFSETDDGRIILVLTGLCRFDVVEEIPTTRGYRRVRAEWSRFSGDYLDASSGDIDRAGLLRILRVYAEAVGAQISWEGFETADDQLLVNALIANLPLDNRQKQSLLETVSLVDRAELLQAILEVAGSEGTGSGRSRRH